jgi:hypothetical protein
VAMALVAVAFFWGPFEFFCMECQIVLYGMSQRPFDASQRPFDPSPPLVMGVMGVITPPQESKKRASNYK